MGGGLEKGKGRRHVIFDYEVCKLGKTSSQRIYGSSVGNT